MPENKAEILIVEDDAAILETLSYNLSKQGFGVSRTTTGGGALKLARKMRPDLILLDIMLPGESGVQVCERIREHDEEVVIVMITAKDAEEDKVRGFEAGADDYVTKPFGMKELMARIGANLKRSGATPEAGARYSKPRPGTRHEELHGEGQRRATGAEAEGVRASDGAGFETGRAAEP